MLLVSLTTASSASGADSSETDPVQIMEKLKPTSGARGIVFVENVAASNPIGLIRYSHIPSFKSDGSIEPSDFWNWKKCSSWTDDNCPIKSGHQIEGRLFLGSCKTNIELGCIESFKAFNSIGAGKKLALVEKSYGSTIDIPQDLNLGIPRSSSPSVYQDEDGNFYVVRAGLFVVVTGKQQPIYKFDADITPVTKDSDPSISLPNVVNTIDPRTGLGLVNVTSGKTGCIAIDVGVCFKANLSNHKYKYSLSVRVPKTVSGWLRARVAEANFNVQPKNATSQLITVTAKPVKMPIAGGWVKYSQLPNGFIEKVWPSGGYDSNPNSSYFLIADPSQGDRGLEEYSAWSPYLKEKAVTSVSNWSFGTNIGGSEQSCLNVPGAISGFVASNASVYSSKPPQWNAANSTLTFKVAAPHNDENGNQNLGTYTLAMPLTSIKCLYGKSNLPPSATVSIVYEKEVTTVATVSLKSDSGWIFFSANEFHYSSPTITVKLGQTKHLSSTKGQAKQAVSVKKAVKKVKTITCVMGKISKKVSGSSPQCPKGFKPK
jgi:hypothetical protein